MFLLQLYLKESILPAWTIQFNSPLSLIVSFPDDVWHKKLFRAKLQFAIGIFLLADFIPYRTESILRRTRRVHKIQYFIKLFHLTHRIFLCNGEKVWRFLSFNLNVAAAGHAIYLRLLAVVAPASPTTVVISWHRLSLRVLRHPLKLRTAGVSSMRKLVVSVILIL